MPALQRFSYMRMLKGIIEKAIKAGATSAAFFCVDMPWPTRIFLALFAAMHQDQRMLIELLCAAQSATIPVSENLDTIIQELITGTGTMYTELEFMLFSTCLLETCTEFDFERVVAKRAMIIQAGTLLEYSVWATESICLADHLYRRAEVCYTAKNYELATELYQKCLQYYPEHTATLQAQVTYLLQQKTVGSGVANLDKITAKASATVC